MNNPLSKYELMQKETIQSYHTSSYIHATICVAPDHLIKRNYTSCYQPSCHQENNKITH